MDNLKKVLEILKSQIPFELKRPITFISAVIALILTGFLMQIGVELFNGLFSFVKPYTPLALPFFVTILTYSINIKINILTAFIFILIFITLYRLFDRKLLKNKKDIVIFEDSFDFGNKGWETNYWGTHNPDKTCRFENGSLIFEATKEELIDDRKEYGAYFDLTTGIYENEHYIAIASVRADDKTTMGIKLWVHDVKGRNNIKYPANFYTPSTNGDEIKVGFTATSTQAMRIHLHIKPGKGKIYVDSLRVVKIDNLQK